MKVSINRHNPGLVRLAPYVSDRLKPNGAIFKKNMIDRDKLFANSEKQNFRRSTEKPPMKFEPNPLYTMKYIVCSTSRCESGTTTRTRTRGWMARRHGTRQQDLQQLMWSHGMNPIRSHRIQELLQAFMFLRASGVEKHSATRNKQEMM